MATNISIPALHHGDPVPAYLARPDGDPRGAIIVIQEIFGINPGITRKVDDWAALGYLAIAPDVFWRQQPGVELDPEVAEELQQGFALITAHDFTLGIQDIEAIIRWIRHDQGIAKVGLVGFCMGGRIAFMAAMRTDIDAAVGYYGVNIDQMLHDGALANPIMLHIPTADGYVSATAQQAMHDGLDGNPHATLHDYEGLDHGFASTFGTRRNEAAAQLADQRTVAFFKENLR